MVGAGPPGHTLSRSFSGLACRFATGRAARACLLWRGVPAGSPARPGLDHAPAPAAAAAPAPGCGAAASLALPPRPLPRRRGYRCPGPSAPPASPRPPRAHRSRIQRARAQRFRPRRGPNKARLSQMRQRGHCPAAGPREARPISRPRRVSEGCLGTGWRGDGDGSPALGSEAATLVA